MGNSIIEAQLTLAEEQDKLQGKITIDVGERLPLPIVTYGGRGWEGVMDYTSNRERKFLGSLGYVENKLFKCFIGE